MMTVHSKRCKDPKTRWNGLNCVKCASFIEPGMEITPNCGYDDDGGRQEPWNKICSANMFNDGTSLLCRPCATCDPELFTVNRCSPTTDTLCGDPARSLTTTTFITTPKPAASPPAIAAHSSALWAVPLVVMVFFVLGVVLMKRKRGQHILMRQPSDVNQGITRIHPDNALKAEIMSAPLQTVLNNLDVLEELVILLDPESQGIRSTKHLASLCSFSSTWITYTCSMRSSKSPLKTVLEAVTCRSPDWTVGHLVRRLKQMERNDAIAVLSKLSLNKIDP